MLDPGSFEQADADIVSVDPLEFSDTKPYKQRLDEAREKTELKEAVLTGLGRISGQPISIAVMDMHFIGGSMGMVVGEKIARTIERGIDNRVPVVIVCGSGGARNLLPDGPDSRGAALSGRSRAGGDAEAAPS